MRVDLDTDARAVMCPVLLLLGAKSPPWAGDISRAIEATLAAGRLVVLPEQRHDAIESGPDVIVRELRRFFDHNLLPS